MAYVKQNFTDGAVLSASQLNHIEDGVADNNVMWVTITYNANTDTYTADKLAYEIYTANQSGRQVLCKYDSTIFQPYNIRYDSTESSPYITWFMASDFEEDYIYGEVIGISGTTTANTSVTYYEYDSRDSAPMIVEFSMTSSGNECDTTAYEIYNAIETEHRLVYAYAVGNVIAMLTYAGEDDGTYSAEFSSSDGYVYCYVEGDEEENTSVDIKMNARSVTYVTLSSASESGGVISGTSSISATDIKESSSDYGQMAFLQVTYSGNEYVIPYTKANMSDSTVTSVEFNKVYLSSSSPATLTCINGVITGTNATVTFTTASLDSLPAWTGGSY